MKVRFAVAPGGFGDVDGLEPLVDGLERLGFDTLWLSDVPLAPAVDPLVGLAFAAGRTTRLKLGANLVPFGRSPALLAKALAQLDRLSDGRVLLNLVVGIDQPGERAALRIDGLDRGRLLDTVVPLLRRWWAGEAVTHHGELGSFDALTIEPRPAQQPLEVWFGGMGPRALGRVGRLGDGWLGAALTPAEAVAARSTIEAAATEAGRNIDPDHFGLSLPYARCEVDDATLAALGARRPGTDPTELVPVGRAALRRLVGRYVEAGLTKFVLRPVRGHATERSPTTDCDDELDWLADAVLDLQT